MPTILVLGANGRLGNAVATTFQRHGWTVRAFVRPGRSDRLPGGVTIFEGNARDADALIAAADGCDVVFNGLNPPYTKWRDAAMPMANAVIAALRASGAVHLFPGNVYNYGAGAGPHLTPQTPRRPTSVKGRIREEMETVFRQAADQGIRTIVLRAGDFYGTDGRGSWFDLVIAKSLAKGAFTYPGPMDVPHAWAYLPDLAEAFVRLAERRHQWAAFEDVTFAGHAMTGHELHAAAERAMGRKLSVRGLPWWLITALSPIVRSWAEIAEMRYLWTEAHSLDGSALTTMLGSIPDTPIDGAVAQAIHDLGITPVINPIPLAA